MTQKLGDIKVTSIGHDGYYYYHFFPKKAGKTTIKCKTGNAVLEYDLTVINPNNLVTKRADLPDNTKVDQIDVTVTGYPYNRTYSIYKQNGKENIST